MSDVVFKLALTPVGWPETARLTAVLPPVMVTVKVEVRLVARPAKTLVWNGASARVTASAARAAGAARRLRANAPSKRAWDLPLRRKRKWELRGVVKVVKLSIRARDLIIGLGCVDG